MAVILIGLSDGTCPANSISGCQSNPSVSSPSSNESDLDDAGTDTNAAWAGIAVVIVVVIVGAGVWYGIRRRRRSRGGHNSVDTGVRPRFTFPRFSFWRKPTSPQSPEQPISVEGEMELGGNEEPKSRRNSLASNLKRTPTAGTVDIDSAAAAKLGAQHKEAGTGAGQYPMVPVHHAQSTETITYPTAPLPSHDASQNPRASSSSSHSSLSRLSIPPPGLGPPIHHPDSDIPSHTAPSSSQS